MLRKDHSTIHGYIEHTTTALFERGLDTRLDFDRGRETRGPGKIVSSYAVLDLDFHGISPDSYRLGRPGEGV
jgi:hypothetical protein